MSFIPHFKLNLKANYLLQTHRNPCVGEMEMVNFNTTYPETHFAHMHNSKSYNLGTFYHGISNQFRLQCCSEGDQ